MMHENTPTSSCRRMSGCFGAKSRACKTFFRFIMIQLSRGSVPIAFGKQIGANGVGSSNVDYIEAGECMVSLIAPLLQVRS